MKTSPIVYCDIQWHYPNNFRSEVLICYHKISLKNSETLRVYTLDQRQIKTCLLFIAGWNSSYSLPKMSYFPALCCTKIFYHFCDIIHFECKAEAPGWHRARSSSTCPAPWWTESCRYAVSTEDNDISKALHLHYYEKRRTEVHYQNHSYTLYTATLPPGILAVKEQEGATRDPLGLLTASPSEGFTGVTFSLGRPSTVSPWNNERQYMMASAFKEKECCIYRHEAFGSNALTGCCQWALCKKGEE